MSKSIGGSVISMEFDIDVQKKDGGSTYKAWSLTYRDESGKTASFTKPMAGLKFQASLKGALQDLKPGDKFVAEMEKNKSDFWEITSIRKGDELPVQRNTQEQYRTDRSAPRYESNDTRQVSIVRQSSLKAAVDFAKDRDLNKTELLELATDFENWVNRTAEAE